MKKVLGKITLLSLAAVLLLGISTVSAASKPKIDSIGKKTTSSVKLNITYDKYLSTKVDAVVSYRNKDTNKTEEKTFTSVKLSSTGTKSFTITGLSSATKYSFKIKIRKHTGGSGYSSWSNSITGKTK